MVLARSLVTVVHCVHYIVYNMDFSLTALHDLEDRIQNVCDSITGTAKCKKIADVSTTNLTNSKANKDVVINMVIKLASVLSESKSMLKTAAAKISELSGDQLVNQKKIIQMQEELIATKSEQIEAVKATVTTELKSYSDVVQQNSKEKITSTTKKLQKSFKSTLEKHDRERSVMVFGLTESNEEDYEVVEEQVNKLWISICPSKPPMRECYRVGAEKPSVDRPVRVIFNCPEAAAEVLRNSKQLREHPDHKHVYITPDRTFEQRAARKKLVNLLKQKINEDPLKYHYIKDGTVHSTERLPKTDSGY